MTFQVEVTAPTQPASSLRTLTGNSGITADRDRRLSESAGHGGILAVPKPAPDLDPPAVTWYNSKSESELAKSSSYIITVKFKKPAGERKGGRARL